MSVPNDDPRLRRIVEALALLGAEHRPPIGWEARVLATATPLELALELDRGPTRRASATLGDTLHAAVRGGRYRAVWIYGRGDVLAVACPGRGSCRELDGTVTADLPLRAAGLYSVVALCADAPLPRPVGVLDRDIAAAVRAGAHVRIEPVRVH
jgi:hypothetical protein